MLFSNISYDLDKKIVFYLNLINFHNKNMDLSKL